MGRALPNDLGLRSEASTGLDELDEGYKVRSVIVEVELGTTQHEASLWIVNSRNAAERAKELVLAPCARHALDSEHDMLVECAHAPFGHVDRSIVILLVRASSATAVLAIRDKGGARARSNGGCVLAATARSLTHARSFAATVALPTTRINGGWARALGRGACGDAEPRAAPARCGTGGRIRTSGGSAAGLDATCKESLTDASECGKRIVVAAADDIAMLAACFFGDGRGRGRLGGGALAKARFRTSLQVGEL